MKKISIFVLALLVLAAPTFAAYIVVMKDGTRLKAKARWTTAANGKAMITLENGTTLELDAREIDLPKTEETNKLGLGNAQVLATQSAASQPQKQNKSVLGGVTKLRPLANASNAPTTTVPTLPPPVTATPADGGVGNLVIGKFQKAYENVGLYGVKVSSTGPSSIRIELEADNEDQVFKAISATSFVMANLPAMGQTKLETLELYMATVRGGAAGRFQMTMPEAEALAKKQMAWQDYYIKKVLF